eukprot:Hpha_TRINITY_DN31298_c0_g1::TRINITY_DN31298_c0_g1_i1::g.2484::m.2484
MRIKHRFATVQFGTRQVRLHGRTEVSSVEPWMGLLEGRSHLGPFLGASNRADRIEHHAFVRAKPLHGPVQRFGEFVGRAPWRLPDRSKRVCECGWSAEDQPKPPLTEIRSQNSHTMPRLQSHPHAFYPAELPCQHHETQPLFHAPSPGGPFGPTFKHADNRPFVALPEWVSSLGYAVTGPRLFLWRGWGQEGVRRARCRDRAWPGGTHGVNHSTSSAVSVGRAPHRLWKYLRSCPHITIIPHHLPRVTARTPQQARAHEITRLVSHLQGVRVPRLHKLHSQCLHTHLCSRRSHPSPLQQLNCRRGSCRLGRGLGL